MPYKPEDFQPGIEPATPASSPKKGAGGGGHGKPGAEYLKLGRPPIPEDCPSIDALPDKLRNLIAFGADDSIGDGTRSDSVLYAIGALHRHGISHGDVVRIVTDPNFLISEHLHEQPRGAVEQACRYLNQVLADEKEDAEKPITDFDDDPIESAESADAQFRAKLAYYIYCLDPTCFIRRARKKAMSEKAFNARYNPLVNLIKKLPPRYRDNAAKLALGYSVLERIDGICYRPGDEDVCVNSRGDRLFNMWIKPEIKPINQEPKIFLAHIDYLIPDPIERKLVLDFLAWTVQHPTRKIMFALLIIDAGGTGKSWIGHLLNVLFGPENVKLLPDQDPIHDTFNGFSENKQVVVANEIVPDGKQDIISRLKGLITEHVLHINEKYIPRHEAENRANVVGFSNFPNSVKIKRLDRRWGVARGADDPYGVDDEGNATAKTFAYYKQLWDCLYEGGWAAMPAGVPGREVRKILWWLGQRDISKFEAESLAPQTDMREEVSENRLSPIELAVKDFHRERLGAFSCELFTAQDVLDDMDLHTLKSVKGDEGTALALVSAAMRDTGCRPVKAQQVRVDTHRKRLWARSKKRAEELGKQDPAALAKLYKAGRATISKEAKPGDFDDQD